MNCNLTLECEEVAVVVVMEVVVEGSKEQKRLW
jgi:hypothetical protein